MGNACDCGVSNILFTTSVSSDNKRSVNGRSYGEGTTGDPSMSSSINHSISMDGNRSAFRVNDSPSARASNAFFRTPTTKRTSRASGGSGRSGGEEGGGNERGSYTSSPEGLGLSSEGGGEGGVMGVMGGKGGGRSEVDRFTLPSPIPVSTTKHEEDMWDNLRHDLRVLDENLTRDTEIFKALPLDALSGGRGGGSRGNSSSSSSSSSSSGGGGGGISSSGSSSSSSMRGEGTYGGNNLGVVVDEEERKRREDQVQSVPLEAGEQLDLMAEAEDALRMIEEEVYSEEDGERGEELRESWEQENDDLSFNIHDSWDQSL